MCEDAGDGSSCALQQSQRPSLQVLLTGIPPTLKTVTADGTSGASRHAIFRCRAVHLCGGGPGGHLQIHAEACGLLLLPSSLSFKSAAIKHLCAFFKLFFFFFR